MTSPVAVCGAFVSTGLPDRYCDKPAEFTVNGYPKCRTHLTRAVTEASLDGVVLVERVKS